MFKVLDITRTRSKGQLRVIVMLNGKRKTMRCGQQIDINHYVSEISLCESRSEKLAVITNEFTKEEIRHEIK
jgi:hypothetical protein